MKKEQEMREEARAIIIEALEDGYSDYYCDLQYEVFNTYEYVTNPSEAKEVLKKYGKSKAIEKVQKYEKEAVGEVFTNAKDLVGIVNVLFYIISESVFKEMFNTVEALSKNWYNQADYETNAEILKAIKEK